MEVAVLLFLGTNSSTIFEFDTKPSCHCFDTALPVAVYGSLNLPSTFICPGAEALLQDDAVEKVIPGGIFRFMFTQTATVTELNLR